MASGYDLSLAPDSRFLKFRDSYTSHEHALDLYDAMRTHTAISAAGHAATVEGLQRLSGQLDGMTWAIEAGFDLIAGEIVELRKDVREGFRGMQEAFAWGIARLCWEQEQNRAVYRQILDVLQHPLQTQALELRRRAERAIANKWWDDAASDLQAALENNRYDYLAHLQLARVMWFEYGQWDPAMEQFELPPMACAAGSPASASSSSSPTP
jgi:tetratricopeptide (TPR) repeat protein